MGWYSYAVSMSASDIHRHVNYRFQICASETHRCCDNDVVSLTFCGPVEVSVRFTFVNMGTPIELEKVAYRNLGQGPAGSGQPVEEEPGVAVIIPDVATASTRFPPVDAPFKVIAI